ncbi:hypothetical protein ANN_23112 [Periplaneta americana]|uniref:Mutator-like transposase domain-containing protein n=1 Tax=Periplaneta americana TaxID=6978 RepID=A0ABQ8SM68_PERAM|nr:hypothetical protein ANN_23112 [Periplaneta americana]
MPCPSQTFGFNVPNYVSKKLGAKSEAFKEWHDRHIPDCEYNYTGSSPAMEMEAAKILWERSKSYGLRYTTVLSDGDAKTFSHLQQIFQRLASDSLLERCASGRTQNANESLHSRIWRKCPKSTSVTKRRVDIAVARAVVEYNLGRSTTQYKIHSKLGLSPGRHTSRISHMQDLKTKYQRASQKSEMYKKYRKSVKLARLKLEEGRKKQEGPTYQAGAF